MITLERSLIIREEYIQNPRSEIVYMFTCILISDVCDNVMKRYKLILDFPLVDSNTFLCRFEVLEQSDTLKFVFFYNLDESVWNLARNNLHA